VRSFLLVYVIIGVLAGGCLLAMACTRPTPAAPVSLTEVSACAPVRPNQGGACSVCMRDGCREVDCAGLYLVTDGGRVWLGP
jgi:hypothetical protein